MSTAPSRPETPTPRWKVALIPVLGLVLLFVLWPSSGSEPELELNRPRSGDTDAASRDEQTPALPPLPHFDVSTALDFNPFETPEAIRELIHGPPEPEPELVDAERATQEQADQVEATVERLRKLQVSAVLTNRSGTGKEAPVAAVVGSRIVRVGDVLENGARVVRIDGNGILVRVDPETDPQATRSASIR
jgi:hypothetical protein